MSEAIVVLIRDLSSGRKHKRFREAGSDQLASFESDNADESGAFEIIAEGLDIGLIERDGSFCRRCWPDDDGSTWTEP